MLALEEHRFRSGTSRFRFYIDTHKELLVSMVTSVWKILLVITVLIAIFSNHWAKSLNESDQYADYKNRCVVHHCVSNRTDPTWLIDLICILSIINLLMELSNILILAFCSNRPREIDILLGLMFILTFIISESGIAFSIYVGSYAFGLPMGYAFYCFLFGVLFSILDWGFSLKRLTSNWPDIIFVTPDQLACYIQRRKSTYALVDIPSPIRKVYRQTMI